MRLRFVGIAGGASQSARQPVPGALVSLPSTRGPPRAGRELSDQDLIEFLVRAGLGTPDTDFKALPQWDFWSTCRQCLSWGGELVTRSAAAGIEGFERLDVPTLLIRGRSTATWLGSVVNILARGMPDVAVIELDGGHACIFERPGEFVTALVGHLDRDSAPLS